MLLNIPEALVNSFWASIGTAVGGILLVIIGVRSGKIPLWWGKKMDAEYITLQEFDNKLRMHCASQHTEFRESFNALKSSIDNLFVMQERLIVKIDTMRTTQVDVLQRVAKIEGRMESAYGADHK